MTIDLVTEDVSLGIEGVDDGCLVRHVLVSSWDSGLLRLVIRLGKYCNASTCT